MKGLNKQTQSFKIESLMSIKQHLKQKLIEIGLDVQQSKLIKKAQGKRMYTEVMHLPSVKSQRYRKDRHLDEEDKINFDFIPLLSCRSKQQTKRLHEKERSIDIFERKSYKKFRDVFKDRLIDQLRNQTKQKNQKCKNNIQKTKSKAKYELQPSPVLFQQNRSFDLKKKISEIEKIVSNLQQAKKQQNRQMTLFKRAQRRSKTQQCKHKQKKKQQQKPQQLKVTLYKDLTPWNAFHETKQSYEFTRLKQF